MAAPNPFQRFALGAASAPLVVHQDPHSKPVASVAQRDLKEPPTRKRKRVIKAEPQAEQECPPPTPPLSSDNTIKHETVPVQAAEALQDKRISLLEQLVQARKIGAPAAIDLYGTQACVFNPTVTDSKTQRFQILVAALLSSQTQDQVTHAAMQRLHTQLEEKEAEQVEEVEGLSIAKVRAATVEKLQELLVPVGFYRRKAQQLKQVADVLHSQYKDDIPRRLSEMLALPGVGPKIARVILLLAWGEDDDGLIVDTHVHRLAQRLHWVDPHHEVKTPEDTRKKLEQWVPRCYWRDFSRNVAGFGQNVCHAVYPKCGDCPLAPQCPSAFQYQHPSKAKNKTNPKTQFKKKASVAGTQVVLGYEALDVGSNESDEFE